MQPENLLQKTGAEVRDFLREKLPANKKDDELLDKEAETIWEQALIGNNDFNAAFIGEEGTYTIEDDPDYAFLVDPLDGTSGALNGEETWITTAVTALEDVDLNGNVLAGKPVGSYIRQINSNGAEFSSWNGEPSIKGEVRFTNLDYEHNFPGTVDGAEISPRKINSFDELDGSRKGIVSTYAAKSSRSAVRENVLWPLERLSKYVRTGLCGGSYTGASVGWGKTLVAGEPKPTLPTEAAGEVFAEAMGAETSDIYGNENNTIIAEVGENGPERSYTTVVAATEGILDETLEAVDIDDLEEAYIEEFETYRELG